MISAIFARSGGPPAAALITSADSRKYCGPIAAGVITQSASHLPRMSMPSSPKKPPVKTEHILIGALLRVPAQAIHRRLINELNAAGFGGLSFPHLAVLQFPGPDGVRPGLLAERAGMSKQAMNQLLRSLESLGYIVRSDVPNEGSARIVHFTKRGRAVYAKMVEVLRDIEREWSVELGPKRFAQLKELLAIVWESPLIR
jgi:DNA-binding MarR family transcriptional regulator